MKVLLSWLRDFAPIDVPVERIGHDLGMLGTPVEEEVHLGQGLEGIVVARVLELRQHPDAKKIQRVSVDAGGADPVEVWCGAFNMAVGDLVPLATVGTTMPSGMEIGRRKILGEVSNGMLCSPKELELSDEGGGILILPPDSAPVGTPIREALGIETDILWDLEINPNRPDAMSVAGIARDLAAKYDEPYTLPSYDVVTKPAGDAIRLEAPDLCGRFTTTIFRGVQIGPSAPLIARRLTLLGMRPINNVVDVSNYVMLELGQPSHPYDLAKVPGGVLGTRRARDGESLVTLDDVERRFITEDLLITDRDDAPIGIAGIMGGATTEIDDSTTDLLVEMAWFQPLSTSKTGRRLALRTEASARFEKGCDPEGIDRAVGRFAELLGVEPEATADVRGELPERAPVRLRTARVNSILGTSLAPAEVRAELEPIGFACEPAGDDHDVSIPSWRLDCEVEIDLVEEVGRHWGYDRIGSAVPPTAHFGHLTERQKRRRQIRTALVGLGLSEAMPMAFLAPGDQARAGLGDDGIVITNPLVADESVLRTALLPGLLKAVAHNLGHRQTGIALFEIGRVFGRADDASAELPDEREHLAVAVAAQEATVAVELWSALAEHLALDAALRASSPPGLHPTRSADVVVGEEVLGSVGEVDPAVLDAYGIGERVAWFEVDLGRLLDLGADERPFHAFSRTPSSDVDLAFEVTDDVPAARVLAAVRGAGEDLLVSVEPFDVYRGPGVAEGSRSLAYRLRFQAPDRTLTDAEVGEARARVIAAVEAAVPARLRG
jgi:phenylalanyl-tRNA synthetase beta chain